jgi:hypothetical protein
MELMERMVPHRVLRQQQVAAVRERMLNVVHGEMNPRLTVVPVDMVVKAHPVRVVKTEAMAQTAPMELS